VKDSHLCSTQRKKKAGCKFFNRSRGPTRQKSYTVRSFRSPNAEFQAIEREKGRLIHRTMCDFMILRCNSGPFQLDTLLASILLSGSNHLSQLKFLGELARQKTEIFDKIVTSSHEGVFRRDFAIGLNAKQHVWNEGMRNLVRKMSHRVDGRMKHFQIRFKRQVIWCAIKAYLVAREKNVRVLKKTSTQKVAQGMVFFVKCEDGGGWDP
jgi:hypothetical protein